MSKDDLYEAIGEVIFEEVQNDEEAFDHKGYRLEQLYQNANDTEKKLIDDVLITICGWSYSSLLNMAKAKINL